ncbi:MAG: hypothetical protein V3R78_12670 [Thermodesulfobacteriota bacterium]
MERTLFIAKAKNLKYFSPPFTRIYFGNEFCERLLPSAQDINQVMDFAQEHKIPFSLVTPYVTNEGLKKWKEIIEKVAEVNPKSEVIFNDWGILRALRGISTELAPVLGRLMTKIKRGPRLMNVMDTLPEDAIKHLQSTNLSIKVYRKFLLEKGITRAELDYPLQDIKLNDVRPDIHLSLYIPFVYVTTTRFCLTASCDIPEKKGMVGIFSCKKECQKYTFALDNPIMPCSLIRKGNTIFYKNEKIPKGDELKEKKIDRLVIQPEIPI